MKSILFIALCLVAMTFAEPEPEADPSLGLRSWGAPALAPGNAWAGNPALGHGGAWAGNPSLRAGHGSWGNPGLGLGRSWGNAGLGWTGRAW